MLEPPSEDDKRRAAADYLHFEDEDPGVQDIYFDTFEEALDFLNDHDLSFITEDWEPFGLFEARIQCKDCYDTTVGQLMRLTIKLLDE